VGRRSFAGPISTIGAPCHALQGGVDGGGGVDRAYDLAEYAVCWRPRRGGGAKRAAEQADAADEGRLEAGGSIMVGLFRGAAVIVHQGKVVRPSQLIRSVLWTLAERAKEEAGGGASRGVHVRPRRHPASSWKPECVESFGATA
jgi:hypothetical protein